MQLVLVSESQPWRCPRGKMMLVTILAVLGRMVYGILDPEINRRIAHF